VAQLWLISPELFFSRLEMLSAPSQETAQSGDYQGQTECNSRSSRDDLPQLTTTEQGRSAKYQDAHTYEDLSPGRTDCFVRTHHRHGLSVQREKRREVRLFPNSRAGS